MQSKKLDETPLDVATVQQRLKEAFPAAFRDSLYSREELLRVPMDFSLFDAEGFQHFLPLALDILLTFDAEEMGYPDIVVLYLSTPYSPGRFAAKQNSFSLFTKLQAEAVIAWLELARSWDELESYQSEIDFALEYWRKFAATRSD